MNYILQINEFYKKLLTMSVSSNAQALYNLLLSVDNSLRWEKKFTMPNTVIMSFLNISLPTLQRARAELLNKGLIIYDKGSKNEAGIYEIVLLYDENDVQKNCEKEEIVNTIPMQSDTNDDKIVNTYNKQNKIKQNEIKLNETKRECEEKKENTHACENIKNKKAYGKVVYC